MTIDSLLQRAPLFILCASIAVLGGAFAFQYLGHLAPCELCIAQRWPYAGTILLSAVALVAPRAEKPHLFLCAAIFAIGFGIAAYHVGVEHHWIAGPEACTGGPTGATTIEELRRQLEATQLVRCDEPAWTLFGISMAGYNAVISLALALFSAVAAFKKTS
jgi:disulfide bond formation protein DsbB